MSIEVKKYTFSTKQILFHPTTNTSVVVHQSPVLAELRTSKHVQERELNCKTKFQTWTTADWSGRTENWGWELRMPSQGTSNWKEPLCLAQVRHAQLLWRNPLYAENAVNLGWTVLIQVFAYSTSHFTLYICRSPWWPSSWYGWSSASSTITLKA